MTTYLSIQAYDSIIWVVGLTGLYLGHAVIAHLVSALQDTYSRLSQLLDNWIGSLLHPCQGFMLPGRRYSGLVLAPPLLILSTYWALKSGILAHYPSFPHT